MQYSLLKSFDITGCTGTIDVSTYQEPTVAPSTNAIPSPLSTAPPSTSPSTAPPSTTSPSTGQTQPNVISPASRSPFTPQLSSSWNYVIIGSAIAAAAVAAGIVIVLKMRQKVHIR
jgi:hypothetical protein